MHNSDTNYYMFIQHMYGIFFINQIDTLLS